MRTPAAVVGFVALIAAGVVALGKTPADGANAIRAQELAPGSLRGVWKVAEQATRSPGGDWTVGVVPYLSLYIFTEKHYSYMFAPGSGPRPLFAGDPNQPSDSEKAAAYDSFVAGSGTYALFGSALTLNATLHKNPNEMKGEPLKYTVDGDRERVVLTIVNSPFSPGRERRTVLRRIE